MNTVRLNITLPKEIVIKLDMLTGAKGKSAFISECIRQKIEQIEKGRLENLLKEGYKNNRAEGLSLAKDFEPVDIEGWDEY